MFVGEKGGKCLGGRLIGQCVLRRAEKKICDNITRQKKEHTHKKNTSKAEINMSRSQQKNLKKGVTLINKIA